MFNAVCDAQNKAKATIIAAIEKYLKGNYGIVVFGENSINGVSQYEKLYLDEAGNGHIIHKVGDTKFNDILTDCNISELGWIASIIKNNSIKSYIWVASSDDGSYNVQSERCFASEEECYNDMRNAALNKMKWNTEYSEDYFDADNYDGKIEYQVSFSRREIIHSSYSGNYRYVIKEIN